MNKSVTGIKQFKTKNNNMINNRKKISVEKFFTMISVKDFLGFLKKPKTQIDLMEKAICALSKSDIEIVHSCINVNGYFTQIDVEIIHPPTGTVNNFQIPYINDVEELLNHQPNFQFHDMLIYLNDLVDWPSLETKLSKKTINTILLARGNEILDEILMMEQVESFNKNIEDDIFLNEILKDEYYGINYSMEDFQNDNLLQQESEQLI